MAWTSSVRVHVYVWEISVRKSTSSPPICKTGTWSCTGEQSALAVPHYLLMVLVDYRVPTPAVRGTVSTPASSLPGLQEFASHRHIVPA